MSFSVDENLTILEAAKQVGIKIPTLCYLKNLNEIGACRICVVEIKGKKNLVSSCVTHVNEGMEIFTHSKLVQESRKTTVELLLSTHKKQCLSCDRNGNCELQALCKELGIRDASKFSGENVQTLFDDSSIHMIRDNGKCILCRRCVAACNRQYVSVIGANNRGFDTQISCAFEKKLSDVSCVSCGQCIVNCPTGALTEKDQCEDVLKAIYNKNKHVIVQTAPAIRVSLGEEFGLPIGTNVKGKMVAALKRLGFDRVFDTNLGADLTTVEEANEFLIRLKNEENLPLITSCSPGWVKFCEYYYPELLKNLSTCKSPQQMMSATIKTWYAQKNKILAKDIVVVGIMPCTAKKFEINRENQNAAGVADTDYVLTTRELAKLIKKVGIDFVNLPDEDFDSIMGESSGAGAIFGVTGGVTEAVLRTVADKLTQKNLKTIDYTEVRGNNNVKEAIYNIAGEKISVAVVSGLNEAANILNKIKSGEKSYQLLEVMCCPGGCINGGGQPIQPSYVRNFENVIEKRLNALYKEDKKLLYRKAHENPIVNQLYSEFFKEPGSELAKQVLHTSYVNRKIF